MVTGKGSGRALLLALALGCASNRQVERRATLEVRVPAQALKPCPAPPLSEAWSNPFPDRAVENTPPILVAEAPGFDGGLLSQTDVNPASPAPGAAAESSLPSSTIGLDTATGGAGFPLGSGSDGGLLAPDIPETPSIPLPSLSAADAGAGGAGLSAPVPSDLDGGAVPSLPR